MSIFKDIFKDTHRYLIDNRNEQIFDIAIKKND